MKISVVVPTYNSSRFIEGTLNSVLAQTRPAHEVLVLDDGSTDQTLKMLEAYQPRVAVRQQKNQGVAATRNALCKLASGDVIAFLDHDDLWHPHYLEIQARLLEKFPEAVASFTGHENFRGYGGYVWNRDPGGSIDNAELLAPLIFFQRYNKATGPFASMSYCCVSKKVLTAMGDEPFRMNGVDDSYLCNVLSLFGSVAYVPRPLVAYRITDESQSKNPQYRVKGMALWVEVFRILEGRFRAAADSKLRGAFGRAFAAKRRQYAKILLEAGQTAEARRQIWNALGNSGNPASLAKSLGLLLATYLPGNFHSREFPRREKTTALMLKHGRRRQ